MSKIYFSNSQFQKLVELVYLGEYMKNAHFLSQEDKYDHDASKLLDYLSQFASDHGMKDMLHKEGGFNNEIDKAFSKTTTIYDIVSMAENLTHRLAERDFVEDHNGKVPRHDLHNPDNDDYNKLYDYEIKYAKEFKKNWFNRLHIVW
jgi:hypothetical protein